MRVLIAEVHNFGGFFGGDTVALSGKAWDAPAAPLQAFTIDESALTNMRERHTMTAGMLFELQLRGERVEAATLLAAPTYAALQRALVPQLPSGPCHSLTIMSHYCPTCDLWIVGEPRGRVAPLRCRLADHPLGGSLDAAQREWYNPHNPT